MRCADICARISSPGRQWTSVAATLHMVPDGMNTAACLPSKSATRSHSKFTVGSSPICSSPTSARAIASRMAGVGRVWVSDNRLMRTGGCLGSRGGGVYMVSSPHQNRHGRACPGHPRLLFVNHKDVDAQDKPGHDETK